PHFTLVAASVKYGPQAWSGGRSQILPRRRPGAAARRRRPSWHIPCQEESVVGRCETTSLTRVRTPGGGGGHDTLSLQPVRVPDPEKSWTVRGLPGPRRAMLAAVRRPQVVDLGAGNGRRAGGGRDEERPRSAGSPPGG